jgi:hypothetical protein
LYANLCQKITPPNLPKGHSNHTGIRKPAVKRIAIIELNSRFNPPARSRGALSESQFPISPSLVRKSRNPSPVHE